MKYHFYWKIVPLFVITGLIASCDNSGTFEQNIQIKNHSWAYEQQPEIDFSITDTTSLYNIYVTLRHTDAYAYRNLWLLISTRQPGDSSFRKERFELTLQEPGGEWIGSGFNDVKEIRYPIFTNIRFVKKGTYQIKLQQNMRDNPLLHIMNAGIRIEKEKL